MNNEQKLKQAQAEELKLLMVLADTLDKVLANHESQVAILKAELEVTKKIVSEYER